MSKPPLPDASVAMDEGRKRLEHIRNDPRVAIDVLDEGGWGALKDNSQAAG